MTDQADCRAEVSRLVELGNKMYHTNVIPRMTDFSLRGKRAGTACYRPGGIYYVRINGEALVKHPEEIFTNTIPHEVAHLIVMWLNRNALFGRKPYSSHGPMWRRVCLALGGNGKTTHDMQDLSNARKSRKTYQYKVASGRLALFTKLMHDRIQNGSTASFRDTGERIAACHFDKNIA